VTEYGNHRISVFKTTGEFVHCFCTYGNKKGELCYPVGVAIDRDGFVYICDQGNNRIQVF
jgi:DNA-binding beta-propeller fold protein YncE